MREACETRSAVAPVAHLDIARGHGRRDTPHDASNVGNKKTPEQIKRQHGGSGWVLDEPPYISARALIKPR